MAVPITKCCVFGSGAFGTAISTVFARLPCKPTVSVHHLNQSEADAINAKHENFIFLPGCPLPSNITFTANVAEALSKADVIVISVPTQFLRGFLKKHYDVFAAFFKSVEEKKKASMREKTNGPAAECKESNKNNNFKGWVPIIIGSKGIEEASLQFPVEIILDVFGGGYSYAGVNGETHPTTTTTTATASTIQKGVGEGRSDVFVKKEDLVVLAGPNFAAEIALQHFSAACVACLDINRARHVQRILNIAPPCLKNSSISSTTPMCPYIVIPFKVYASSDVIGCEVASAVKNVIAIASGACKGIGQENNCRAALIVKGMRELCALVHRLGGSGESLNGLAGVGDLLLTCGCENSRNFSVGLRLGRGEPLEHILKTSKAVAEGVATSRALKKLAERMGCEMPICDAVYSVMYTGASAKDVLERLLMGATPYHDEITGYAATKKGTPISRL